jgi:hypothetical protein
MIIAVILERVKRLPNATFVVAGSDEPLAGFKLIHSAWLQGRCIERATDGKAIAGVCKGANPAQNWVVVEFGNVITHGGLRNAMGYKIAQGSGQCLDAGGNGTNVYTSKCDNGNPYQLWFPQAGINEQTGVFLHAKTGKCLLAGEDYRLHLTGCAADQWNQNWS